MRDWIKALPLSLGLPIVIGVGSVKPEDAASNVAAWLHLAGVERVPEWLTGPNVDSRVILGSLGLGAVYAFLVWGVPALRPLSPPKINEPAPPEVAKNAVPLPISGADWRSAEHAVERFAGVHLIKERNEWRETFQESYLAGQEAQAKISALQNTMGNLLGVDATGQLEASRRRLQVSVMQNDMAKEELKRAWDALRDDMEGKLASGTLIAKGFRAPHIAGNNEVTIAAAEWRVLTLNDAKAEALRKGSGEVLYTGLLIGKSG